MIMSHPKIGDTVRLKFPYTTRNRGSDIQNHQDSKYIVLDIEKDLAHCELISNSEIKNLFWLVISDLEII